MRSLSVKDDALNEVGSRTWDALFVGAGPAGALAALNLARLGHPVLLVDAKEFPRNKVCGGCLNARAQALLAHCGLTDILSQCEATPVDDLQMMHGRRRAKWPLTGTLAVNRAEFDDALVRKAMEFGVHFLSHTSAQVLKDDRGPLRHIQLKRGVHSVVAQAKVVLCADGLSRSSLRSLDGFTSQVDQSSRVGIGAVVEDDGPAHPSGQLTMAVGRHGYVGITRISRQRLNVAASVDAKALASSTPGELVQEILDACGCSAPKSLLQQTWHGTPTLTRSNARLAAHRLFVLGDAAGYVEPFTGEGMSLAMHTSVLSVPFVQAAIAAWEDRLIREWERSLKRKVLFESWSCRQLSRLVRMPRLAALSLEVCRLAPSLPESLSRHINDRPITGLPPMGPASFSADSAPHYRKTG